MTTAAPTPKTESPSDRRRAARFQPAFGTICHFRRHGEEGERSIGLVWNISETGVSMLLADPPARGTQLDGELTTESGVARMSVKLQVVHIRKMPHGDYFLGGHFEQPLTPDELQRFLAAQITPKEVRRT
ncbi:MAG: PilZ domain-containing protein [Planctomycetes bacterium]|nr:PilZ domain-containing protein [Planctomycetota bacterium]